MLIWLDEMNWVDCATPFHRAVVDEVKLQPQIARGISGPPATAELGINDVAEGAPLDGHAPGLGFGHAAAVGVAVGVGVAVAVAVAVPTALPLPVPLSPMLRVLGPLLSIVSLADFLPSLRD